MPIFTRKPICPYCGNPLNNKPKRKAKCPYCKQNIFIHEGKLITEETSQLIYWFPALDKLLITKQKFYQSREELSLRFNSKASVLDTVWFILNNLVAANPFSEMAIQAYYEMAKVAVYEQKDETPYIKEALRTQLNYYKIRGVKKVRITGYGMGYDGKELYDCPMCEKLSKKVYTMEEALEKMLIPCSDPDISCTCKYGPAS